MSARNTSICLGLLAVALTLALTVAPGRGVAQTAAAGPNTDLLVVGDSLAVGTMPYLDGMLPSGVNVTWDAVDGRTTPQGIESLQFDLREVAPEVVAVSLGSNDGPDPKRFSERIRRMLADLPVHTCVVWFTIVRPARKGRYAALNEALRAEARRDPRLVVINWDHAVARGTVRLRDGLHADAAGYRYRSSKIVQAVHSGCSAE
jgi:lysophospholipase L1-like esterase